MEQVWRLLEDTCRYPASVHGRAGEELVLPYMGAAKEPLRSELSLLEKRDGAFVKDRFGALSIRDGYVRVTGLPAGDYDLVLKSQGARITLRLTEGEKREGYVMSSHRQLETQRLKPLQITGVEVDEENVKARLGNATRHARVHVVATWYLPEFPPFEGLDAVAALEPTWVRAAKAESLASVIL